MLGICLPAHSTQHVSRPSEPQDDFLTVCPELGDLQTTGQEQNNMADRVAFQENRVATPELSLLGACDQGDAICHRKIRERFEMLNGSRPASQNGTEVITGW